MLEWLENVEEFPKIYWQERGSAKATLGYGLREEDISQPLFGVLGSSSLKKDRVWEGIDRPFFFLQKFCRHLMKIKAIPLQPFPLSKKE